MTLSGWALDPALSKGAMERLPKSYPEDRTPRIFDTVFRFEFAAAERSLTGG
jgi:hypothetical protein